MSHAHRKDEDVALPPGPAAADTGLADGSAAAPSSEIDELRQQLQAKTEEAHQHSDRYLRERAELENFKRRMLREKGEALRFASEPLIRELLPIVDNLERAIEHGGSESVVEGVRLVLKSLLEILERHGVKRIEAVGEPFDPARHQAMAQVESAEHEPNHVVHQHHSGYLLYERLLRPALVTVSARKPAAAVESNSNSD